MKNALRTIIVVLAFAGLGGAAFGAGPSVTLKAGYLLPTASVFRDVYGAGPVFGGEIAVPLTGPLHLWAGADFFSKTGSLSVTEEETKARIIPLYAGLRAHFGQKNTRPYIGAAAALFLFHEENVLGTISESGLGFLARAGLLVKLGGAVWLDIFTDYRACALRADGDDPVEAKLDAVSAGLGLVFRF